VINNPPGSSFLWYGAGSFEWERLAAKRFALEILRVNSPIQVEDGSQNDAFLKVIKNADYDNAAHWKQRSRLPVYAGETDKISDKSAAASNVQPYETRLWRINFFLNGNPTATEISPFVQSDLDDNDVYILDNYFNLFVWAGNFVGQGKTATTDEKNNGGSSAGFRELKLALVTARNYVEYVNSAENGRLDHSKAVLLQSGQESADFKSQFLLWKKPLAAARTKNWPSGLTVNKALAIVSESRYSASELLFWAQTRKDLPFGVDIENLEVRSPFELIAKFNNNT
jgi:hypothetical protein